MNRPLIDPVVLKQWLEEARPLTILDCRARLGDPEAGRTLWSEGHIPTSRHLDLDRELAAPPGEDGRHPLPSQSAFTTTLQRLGVTPGVPVVVYDDMGGQLAGARAWWMLHRWAGHPRVMLLDGGFQAWRAEGGAIRAGAERAHEGLPSDWSPGFDDGAIVGADDIVSSTALKLDARAQERFRGDKEPIDSVAGHIPGAHCRPSAVNLGADGRFKPAAALDTELPRADEVIVYCGSGLTACHNILAYALTGRPLPKLYAGSWSHWISDPSRPVATGE